MPFYILPFLTRLKTKTANLGHTQGIEYATISSNTRIRSLRASCRMRESPVTEYHQNRRCIIFGFARSSASYPRVVGCDNVGCVLDCAVFSDGHNRKHKIRTAAAIGVILTRGHGKIAWRVGSAWAEEGRCKQAHNCWCLSSCTTIRDHCRADDGICGVQYLLASSDLSRISSSTEYLRVWRSCVAAGEKDRGCGGA